MSEENIKIRDESQEEAKAGLAEILDQAIADSREEGFYGSLKFYLYKLNEDQLNDFHKKLEHIIDFFPESFRNPFNGEFVEKDFRFSKTNEGEYIFYSKSLNEENDKPFFALKLKEDKKFNVNGLKNDSVLFVLTLIQLIKSINPDSVKFSKLSSSYDEEMMELILAQLLINYKEEEISWLIKRKSPSESARAFFYFKKRF